MSVQTTIDRFLKAAHLPELPRLFAGRPPTSAAREARVPYDMAGRERRAHPSWYRGEEARFHPRRANLREQDAIDRYVVDGWAPPAPFIDRNAYITPFGSCFAQHVSRYLSDAGYNVFGRDLRPDDAYVIRCGEGMVNAAVIAQQFQWAYDEVQFDEALWHDKQGDAVAYLESVKSETRAIFDGTDVFILTLGLSETWYNKVSGDVFWRSVPRDQFDPAVHGFKVMSVAETRIHLATIYRIIRKRRPGAVIIFTLSPIPLTATFRPVSCMTANSASKAVLRAAIDEFMRANADDANLFYFPSYEITKDFWRDPYGDDLRHVRPENIRQIMDTFSRHFLIR